MKQEKFNNEILDAQWHWVILVYAIFQVFSSKYICPTIKVQI